MGNTASYSCFSVGSSKKTATLLDTRGNVREIKLPVRSGELMIELLGHVITPVEDLRRTRRVSALTADEELVAGKVYLLAPASRVHCKASEFEMAIAEQWGQRKRKSLKVNKVSPLSASDGEIRVNSFPEKKKLVGNGIPCHQLRTQRRWNPVLRPILESP
ncbi:hypothetical protein VNO77_13918 [Canavalia gladiata]|uniref:Uncharacterized protein n=1 Tax=Canavalia gladiata TaxID=3824 RepID=A0AAN9LXR3_CANGL